MTKDPEDQLVDLEVERVVLGSVLVAVPGTGPKLLREMREDGLDVAHFSAPAHQALFVALCNAAANGAALDDETLIVSALADDPRVPEPRRLIDAVAGAVFAVENGSAHAIRVIELAGRRTDAAAARMLWRSAVEPDRHAGIEQRAQVMAMLSQPVGRSIAIVTPHQAAERFLERSEQPAPERFPFPWPVLNQRTGGGLARKQNIVIGGFSGIGKTAACDQIMWHLAVRRYRVAIYLTEMNADERFDRNVSRLARVDYGRVDTNTYRGDATETDHVMLAVNDWGTTGPTLIEAAGWTADEVAADVMLNRWDAFAVDVLHEIAHHEKTAERGISKAVQTLRHTAVRGNAALVICAHLNDGRYVGGQRPEPVARDIRDSGMVHRGADIVLFVHREDDEHGVAQDRGIFKIDKTRKGQPSRFDAVYRGRHLEWIVAAPSYMEARAA